MAGELTTIARPYAEAAFKRALETDKLDLWSDMLELLSAVAADNRVAGLIANPRMEIAQLSELMLEIGGGRLSDEGQNFVRLLAENRRLGVLSEIQRMFGEMKSAHEGALDVVVTSAFPMKPAQEAALADALKKKLDREVRISVEEDSSLIGGVRIRAGDLVIDGSIREQLGKLTNELGI
ncbi:MAG: F0F1 ATP synthase subunit delta [bacterium]